MLDFMTIATRYQPKQAITEIYPKFKIVKTKDLMIRGGDFYAVWDEERQMWSTDEHDVKRLVDDELRKFADDYRAKYNNASVQVSYMWDADSGVIDKWHKYCQKQMRDSYRMLDENLIFSNTEVTKEDYASKSLPYPLEKGGIKAWDRLISTLYSEEERHKIEWAIGAIVTGESKHIQKFMVLYGAAGTGKSTVLNVVQQLFEGYYSVFDARALGSSSDQFSLEAFKNNPLVAIQHDGDLSRLEDNTRINSLVSHEEMTVNEKHKGRYTNRFKCFLFMGTNKPVKITDGKSGLIRRLIDVTPSGNKLNPIEYKRIMKQVEFELGAIACHCRDVYLDDPGAYDEYIPTAMMGASNDFYNYVIDSYSVFLKEDGTTLKAAWEMYKTYCDEAKVPFPMAQRGFKEELKNYFRDYNERYNLTNGTRVRSYYSGFRTDIFETESEKKPEGKNEKNESKHSFIEFRECSGEVQSEFDKACSGDYAQYANSKEAPVKAWDKVRTKLSDIDTSRLHYVKVPENHIVIDFDIKDESGNKSLEKNIEEASKWPPTYAELSKSGCGIHLHYIYTGDVNQLSNVYDDKIEIKVFKGKSSLRRKLTKCNDLPIATISSGLPLKGEDKVLNLDVTMNEKAIRTLIKKNLNKEYHPGTKPSVDFIYKILDDAYNNGIPYDVTDMQNDIYAFAANSTNQATTCIKLVKQMKFKSEDISVPVKDDNDDSDIVFYDVEVFPNLFLVNYKMRGEGKPVIRMINPTPSEIEALIRLRLVGFNCRRYDNHILYARLMGYTNEQLYNLSQKIINSKKGDRNNGLFGEAYNISYTDVYDFASAGNKQSLKKWEIQLGIHHQELGLPWDEPVPEEMWTKVAEYCDNDVIATEAVFDHLVGDWTARQILADLTGLSRNDTTNTLTTKLMFSNNKKPQSSFNYRNLAEPVLDMDVETYEFLSALFPEMMSQTHGEAGSALPYFPGYKYENGVSTYRGETVGEGGYVYAEPGMYGNVALLDVASMHPHSALTEALFGVEYSKIFEEIVYGRVHIKHEDWEKVNQILGGKLTPYVQKVINGEMTSKQLANALKTAINSVYGLTAANFDNPFHDPRNKDNIVAKRGALFMIDLKNAVQERGFTVVHIKTDSIKIADATPEIIEFVMDFGKKYGYTFEHEATYDRICLVNDAVYIAKDKATNEWTATGTQFAVPYVFKTLFTKEPIEFEDMCVTNSVKTAIYLDMNESLPDVSEYEKELDKLETKYKKGLLSDTTFEEGCRDLSEKIAEGHDYQFVGKVGSFCPIKPGRGGGILQREQNGKYYAVTGTKGYRWAESEIIRGVNEDAIDTSYFEALVHDAIGSLVAYGDYTWFVSDDPYLGPFDDPNAIPFL